MPSAYRLEEMDDDVDSPPNHNDGNNSERERERERERGRSPSPALQPVAASASLWHEILVAHCFFLLNVALLLVSLTLLMVPLDSPPWSVHLVLGIDVFAAVTLLVAFRFHALHVHAFADGVLARSFLLTAFALLMTGGLNLFSAALVVPMCLAAMKSLRSALLLGALSSALLLVTYLVLELDLYDLPLKTGSDMPNVLLITVVPALIFLPAMFMLIDRRLSVVDQLVTDRARLLHMRKRADRAMRRNESFLSLLSHEVRTPLNLIMASADLLCAASTKLDDEEKSMLSESRSAAESLVAKFDSVVDYLLLEDRRFTLNLAPVMLAHFAHRSSSAVEYEASRSNVELVTNLLRVPLDLEVRMDAPRMQQVLTQLLLNACQHADTFVVLTCAVSARGGNWSAADVVFEVTDDGKGINDSRVDEAFEPFMQVHESSQTKLRRPHEGMGLGLTLARALVGAMNGSLQTHRDASAGTTSFTVDLPLEVLSHGGDDDDDDSDDDGKEEKEEEDKVVLPNAVVVDAPSAKAIKKRSVAVVHPNARTCAAVADVLQRCDNTHTGIACYTTTESLSHDADEVLLSSRFAGEIEQVRRRVAGRPVTVLQSLGVVSSEHKSSSASQTPMFLSVGRSLRKSRTDTGAVPPVASDSAPMSPSLGMSESDMGLLRIAIVDDNDFNVRIAEQFVAAAAENVGIAVAVDTFGDGQSFLASLKSVQPHGVLLDMHMPRMDGIACVQKIREAHKKGEMFVAAVTADVFLRERALAEGCDAFIAKPLRVEQLQEVLLRLGSNNNNSNNNK